MCLLIYGILGGCTAFNTPFVGDAFFLVVTASSPELHFYALSPSTNTLTEFASVDTGFTVGLANTAKGIVVYANGAGNAGTVLVQGNRVTKMTERSGLGGITGIGVTDDQKAIYWSSADDLNVRSLTQGVIASADTQTTVQSVSADYFDRFIQAPDGTGLIAGLRSAAHIFNVFGFTRSPTTGTLTASGSGAGYGSDDETQILAAAPQLGDGIYFYSSLFTLSVARVNGTTSTSLASTIGPAGALAADAHPTQPWMYTLTAGPVLRRYTATLSSVQLSSTTSLQTGTPLSLLFNASGDRMIEFLSSGVARIYTVASDGSVALVNTQTLVTSTLPMRRIGLSRN